MTTLTPHNSARLRRSAGPCSRRWPCTSWYSGIKVRDFGLKTYIGPSRPASSRRRSLPPTLLGSSLSVASLASGRIPLGYPQGRPARRDGSSWAPSQVFLRRTGRTGSPAVGLFVTVIGCRYPQEEGARVSSRPRLWFTRLREV